MDFRISLGHVGPFDTESSFNDYLSEYFPDCATAPTTISLSPTQTSP
jgi:hypothetical protein